jgi:hypothetical protein
MTSDRRNYRHANPPTTPTTKRGRPTKFDRPSRLVALTLPEDLIDGLRRINNDLAWAIVTLFQKQGRHQKMLPVSPHAPQMTTLVGIPNRQFLIVVDRTVFRRLPNVNLIPLTGNHAFLAFADGGGLRDLELAIGDRLDEDVIGAHERKALVGLRLQLRKWRRDRTLAFERRTIVIVRPAKPRRSG